MTGVFLFSEHRESPFDNVKRKTIEDIPGLTEDMLTEIFNEAKQETFEEEMLTRLYDQQDGEPQTLQSSHYKRFVPELEPVRIGALMKEKTIKKLAQKLGYVSTNYKCELFHKLVT